MRDEKNITTACVQQNDLNELTRIAGEIIAPKRSWNAVNLVLLGSELKEILNKTASSLRALQPLAARAKPVAGSNPDSLYQTCSYGSPRPCGARDDGLDQRIPN